MTHSDGDCPSLCCTIWDIPGIDARESKSIGMGVAAQSETNVGCMCWNSSEGWGSLAFLESQQNNWSTANHWTSAITFTKFG